MADKWILRFWNDSDGMIAEILLEGEDWDVEREAERIADERVDGEYITDWTLMKWMC